MDCSAADFEGVHTIYEAVGCEACMHTGFAGRLAIFEMIEVSEAMRNAIHTGAGLPSLRRIAHKEGVRSLRQDGARHVKAGHTSIDEVLRVTGQDAVMVEA